MDTRDESTMVSAEQSSLLDPSMCSAAGDTTTSNSSVLNTEASHPLKVYLRVRPFSKSELTNNESQECVTTENAEIVSLRAPKDSSTMKNCERGIGQSVHKFTFTRIFGEDTTQADFFEGTVKDLVVSFANGQNGLVFNYGVTNAGKTFTIQGTPKDGGILPRSLDVVFDHIRGRQYVKMNLKPYLGNDVMKLDPAQVKQEEAMKGSLFSSLKEDGMKTVVSSNKLLSLTACEDSPSDQGVTDQNQFSAWVSFFEIYNEYVYDLLDQFPTSKNQKRPALKICDDQLGTSYVKDLKWFNITSTEEACKILQIGNKNRSLASTKMNQQSSRSHSIFTIRLLKLGPGDDPSVLGVSEMSLCDLAGSERCNKTQTVGDRLKEAGNINNSLLILGKCIAALKQSQNPKKASYVPFRESKLTRLFQPFFCGKGKACMIVNINQCASTYDETLHVMKFSAVAKQVVQTIQPRNFDFINPRIVGKDGKIITEIDANLSMEDLLSEDEDEEMDISVASAEDLLRKIEELKEKLMSERQNKLLLEMQIRKEMGEAMYQQMVQLDETWSKRFEDYRETTEEQLEGRLEMYRKAIKNHAHRQAMEELEEDYVTLEEFQAEQEKVEERDRRIEELEIALGLHKQSGDIESGTDSTSGALEALTKRCQDKEKIIIGLKVQIQNIKDEADLNGRRLTEENDMLKQHLKIKEQEIRGLQNLAERAIQLEASVTELQVQLDESKKRVSSVAIGEPKPKKGLFSSIKNTMTGTPKKSKGVEKIEETTGLARKKPLLRK
ncbi:kinesin-like protein KIF20A [Hyla sarda]|uniref:kinesin-like protein KIF20A n=1 Tax=Hyla sarda TaxID=327740 RepID=UPI0024C2D39F|nr:kinesin-like protein KIF20A [Hyla sarda]XP_056374540.1 kinesin-like protein KIF20A [Hyla sarda]XP_056374541.1 kinesin-like protein KIF20A [Hyla sarda]